MPDPGPSRTRPAHPHRGLAPWLATASAVLVLAALAAPSVAAQDTGLPGGPGAGDNRPRVGLVLGGGGARGFAHLGVLQVLHELRVPVDFVVGTSMGAVVGGITATGAPPPQVVRLFRREDWDAVFRDRPPREALPIRRKRDDRRFQMGLDVGLGPDGVRLPSAASSGARLTNALEAYTWSVREVEDFDRLPVPFRAVATDVETGEAVILDRGELAGAIRGSMAVPGIFTPARIQGRLLVDGGLVMNLPVSVARELEPDVLVVVDVGRDLDDLPEPTDVLGVLNRSLAVMTGASVRRERARLAPADILVEPRMPELGSSDFSILEEALAAGRDAARAVEDRLRPLAVDQATYDALLERRARDWRWNPSVVLSRVRVDTAETRLGPPAVRVLLPLEPGRAVELFDLPDLLLPVLGDGGFRSAGFDLLGEADSATLVLRPRDKPWGPTFLRGELALADRLHGEGGWQLTLNLLRTRLTSRGGEGEVDLELGLRQGVRVLVDQPLRGPRGPFVGAWAGFGRTETRRPTNGVVAEVEAVDRGLGIFAGVRSAAWGELRAGLERIEFDVDGDPDLPEERGELAVVARWEVDGLDQVPFASSGALAVVELRSARAGLGAGERFDRLDARGAWAVSRGRHALRLAASWVTGFGEPLPFTRQATPGGFLELTALEPGALRGSTAATISLVHAFRPGGPASGREGRLRLGASVEAGRAWDADAAVQPLKLRPGASLWIGAETPLGPVGLAWGWLRGERPGWVARVGFGL